MGFAVSDRVDISRRQKIAGARSLGASGFSLFEVVLAVALSAIVMVLIGMAIDICLTEFDSGRAKVEQAQLARAIFSHLEDDLQHVLQYTPQDIQSFRQLAASQAQ